MNTTPTKEQADQFALMLESGMPSLQALTYFADEDSILDSSLLKQVHDRWMKSTAVKGALLALQGKPWQGMDLMEKIKYALDRQYAQMAYFIYTHNYVELNPTERAKADTCRQVLELKLAGRSGKETPLEEFTRELLEGKIKMTSPRLAGRPSDQSATIPTIPLN